MYVRAKINDLKIRIIKNPFEFFFIIIAIFFFYDYVLNLDIYLFPKYELPSILILTALGTIGAVVVALFLPNYQERLKKQELRQSLVSALIQEIYLNFYSIHKAGMMEIRIEKDQYEAVQKNIYLFPPFWIETLPVRIKQMYNLFNLYEYYWTKQNPNYDYFMYEIKFKIKIELLIFIGVLKSEDNLIREYLTQVLIELRGGNPLWVYDLIGEIEHRDKIYYASPLEYLLRNITRSEFNSRLEHNIAIGDRMDNLVVEYFDRYINDKYKVDALEIRQLLKNKIY